MKSLSFVESDKISSKSLVESTKRDKWKPSVERKAMSGLGEVQNCFDTNEDDSFYDNFETSDRTTANEPLTCVITPLSVPSDDIIVSSVIVNQSVELVEATVELNVASGTLVCCPAAEMEVVAVGENDMCNTTASTSQHSDASATSLAAESVMDNGSTADMSISDTGTLTVLMKSVLLQNY